MDQRERIFIVIDGSNFYHRIKELNLQNLLKFDYVRFSEFIAGERAVVIKRYYIAAVREEFGNEKSKELMKNQRILSGKLKNFGWEISFGHMLKTDAYREKGVDVQIATDILIGAYENLYDTVVLISSDTDLIPALIKAKEKGKKIEYVGFSHKPSHALISRSDVRRLLIKEDLEKFI